MGCLFPNLIWEDDVVQLSNKDKGQNLFKNITTELKTYVFSLH